MVENDESIELRDHFQSWIGGPWILLHLIWYYTEWAGNRLNFKLEILFQMANFPKKE